MIILKYGQNLNFATFMHLLKTDDRNVPHGVTPCTYQNRKWKETCGVINHCKNKRSLASIIISYIIVCLTSSQSPYAPIPWKRLQACCALLTNQSPALRWLWPMRGECWDRWRRRRALLWWLWTFSLIKGLQNWVLLQYCSTLFITPNRNQPTNQNMADTEPTTVEEVQVTSYKIQT